MNDRGCRTLGRPAVACYASGMRWPLLLVALWMCACSGTEQETKPPRDAEPEADAWDPTPRDAGPELFDTAPRDVECLALTDAGPKYETGSPAQAWCDAVSNPAECPSARPMAGDPCTTASVACRYWEPSGSVLSGSVLVATCPKGTWYVEAHQCQRDCTAWDAGTTSIEAACGSAPEIPCRDIDAYTDYERASHVLRDLGQCCGGLVENKVRARFEDGCVKALEVGRNDGLTPNFLECMTRLLAGRRIACAKATCAEAEWTTLK